MRHYRRRWNERREDRPSWGGSDWFFEVDADGTVLRQLERYDNGTVLRYDDQHADDDFGQRSVDRLDESEWRNHWIPAEEFEVAWSE